MTDPSTQRQKKNKASRRNTKFSSEAVLSSQDCTVIPRKIIQRTPKKICTLSLPPPIPSLFDEPISAEIPNARHKRYPSDLISTAISVDPSLITEASHPTPGRHSNASVTSPDVPHLRIGMSCDPLIAYDLVMVATVDGRIAVYQLMDYELDIDEDVVASERRRKLEWEEEDDDDPEDEQKSLDDSCVTDEDDDANERLGRREKLKESVDPILVISLPAAAGASEEDDNSSHIQLNQVYPLIVGMCAPPKGVNLMKNEISRRNRHTGHVAALTDDGGVHILQFQFGAETGISNVAEDDSCNMNNQLPAVKVVCSFRTNYLDATCICMQPMFQQGSKTDAQISDRNAYGHIGGVQLCVGHECGVLECYRLRALSSSSETEVSKETRLLSPPYSLAKSKSNEIPRSNSKSNLDNDSPRRNTSILSAHLAMDSAESNVDDSFDPSTKLFRTFSEPLDQVAKTQQSSDPTESTKHHITVDLCWRGSLSAPIRSLSCAGWSPKLVDSRAQSLLVIGLMRRSAIESRLYEEHHAGSKNNNHHLSPAISLEVIDASLAQHHWSQTMQEASTNEETIPLNECTVWPAAGMEIKDSSTGVHARETIRQDLGLKSHSVTNKICQFIGSIPGFAFAVSDGTVGISHFNDDGSWGIQHNFNQLMLPQRCIGIGAIEYESGNNSRYICCCLRGGTIYVVPVIDRKENPNRPLTLFNIPVDPTGEEDGLVRYVQCFASGIVQLNSWEDPRKKPLKPVVMVGWNGGTVDVYDIAQTEHEPNQAILCAQLIERGGARLIEKLLIVSRSHPLVSSPLWIKSWDECNKVKDVGKILQAIKDVSNRDFVSTRALLLSFAEL